MRNCVDIIRPFVAEVGQEGIQHQVIGGTGSAALALAETKIIPAEQLVIAPSDLFVPQFRDKNGRNKRDLDDLVLTSDPETIGKVEAIAEETIGKDLKRSIFGLRPDDVLASQKKHRFLSNVMVWVSDRYVEEVDGELSRVQRALFPLAIDIDVASLDTWHLQIGHEAVRTPIPHPAATVLNYATRSISGLRPKDSEKLLGSATKPGIAQNVLAVPGMKEWMFDGPGKEAVHFAAALQGLRQPLDNQQPLTLAPGVEILPIHPQEIRDDRVFMFHTEKGSRKSRGNISLRWAALRARNLHRLEQNEKLVDFWQRVMENAVSPIVHNK